MKLEGIHHVTAITGDAPGNVDFYARVLGLRLVKKTVNQDDPTVYHLFYADERGSRRRGHDLLRVPGRPPRPRRAPGWCTPSSGASRSEERARLLGATARRRGRRRRRASPAGCGSPIPRGSGSSWPSSRPTTSRSSAESPEIPREHALQGFDGVRAYAADPERSAQLLAGRARLRGARATGSCEVRGDRRGGFYAYDPAPADRGIGGAGTVHHVAFASTMEEHDAWRERAREHGLAPTPVIDRFYFRSIYFREPSGVLFEIATIGPGFTTDEPAETPRRARCRCRRTSSTCASGSSRC